MNVSVAWLRDFVDADLTPARLRDLITMRVATVDALERVGGDPALEQIVVARVVEVAKHPNAEKLSLTRVDDGGPALLEVVCGAPNVQAGKLYPFARTGTVMPDGLEIEKRKIRGAVSNGMLCSARELRLGEGHEGIMELDVDVAPGTALLAALPGLTDHRLVIDVMPNRPDLLSHLGVARELAAAVARRLHLPRLDGDGGPVAEPARARREGRTGGFTVRVEDEQRAPRYMGAVIRGVTIGPSPEWLVRRLEAVGARSINNVVDATNYILRELGQPIHAFDADALAGRTVIVRRARAGERLVTLDAVDRKLDPEMLVIADAERVQALAGVMGGRDSEVGPQTRDIFLEVALFEPRSTRAMRRALGMTTDASYRFERGVDPELQPVALARAARLIVAVAGGALEGAPVDVLASDPQRPQLSLRVERVRRLLGEAVPAAEIVSLLRSVGFMADVRPGTEMLKGHEEIVVGAPSWRRDVSIEEDLVEEVARLRGYETFSSELRPFRPGRGTDDRLWVTSRRVRETLVAAGLYETRPMPFVAGAEGRHVRVANPLAENEAHLRRSLLETLARRAEHNLAHQQRAVRLFEVGNAFEPAQGALPREELRAAALVLGPRHPPHFTDPDKRNPPLVDEWDAKALAERMLRAAYPAAQAALRPAAGDDADLLWEVVLDGAAGASSPGPRPVGQVRRVPLDAPVWAAPAYGVEVLLSPVESAEVAPPGRSAWSAGGQVRDAIVAMVASAASAPPQFQALPAMPAAPLDLALLVPERVSAAAVERAMRGAAGPLLESATVFDEYRGDKVPAGHRSVAWRLVFRDPDGKRTLGTKEVEGRRDRILRTLEAELGVRQRTA